MGQCKYNNTGCGWPTDSYWTRDYGPWWVVDGNGNMSVVDFTYDRPRPNDIDAPFKISEFLDVHIILLI